MFCSKCGHLIGEGERFCTRCGTPVTQSQQHLCPECGAVVSEEAIYCGKCGTFVGKNSSPVSPQPNPGFSVGNTGTGPQPNPGFFGGNTGTTPQPTPGKDDFFDSVSHSQELKKYSMISLYEGETSFGVAKATGTLTVYADRLELAKKMGNALGNLSLAGMVIAKNQMKKEGSQTEVYYMKDILDAKLGKYAAVFPTLILTFTNGRTITLTGTLTNQAVTDILNLIRSHQANQQRMGGGLL